MSFRRIAVALILAAPWAAPAVAQSNNACDQPGEYPDIIVGDITDTSRYGTIGGITSYAIGTTSCNLGTCQANWVGGTPNHPVIGQNMFRFKDGRFEQIGQSWLKHGFAALQGSVCSNSCIPADGSHLGVNCSDPYGSGLNGSQGSLGPKYQVNPKTGVHLHPYATQGQTGDSLYKRLQVHNVDLDPALNPGAQYFVEGQYVAADDAAAGKQLNNNSWRKIIVSGSDPTFNILFSGPTVRTQAAIWAWATNDTGVHVARLGAYLAAEKVSDLGGGVWHYEYAVQNLVDPFGSRTFAIPVPHGATITNVGFHDVDYHSGEPNDGTDWTATLDTSSNPWRLVWSTATAAENPNANALRWGTLYNFRFDVDAPPATAKATLESFGSASVLQWDTQGPIRCGDAFCDKDEGELSCAADCAFLGDSGEVPSDPQSMLQIDRAAGGDLALSWGASCMGGDVDYEVYEGTLGSFDTHRDVLCSTSGATEATITPAAGGTYYLVVPNNGFREGSYGQMGDGTPRGQGLSACMAQSVGTCP